MPPNNTTFGFNKSDGKNIPNRVKMRSPAFCNLSVLSEVKFKPVYLQICKERDEYYSEIVRSIFVELINKDKNKKLSAKKITTSLLALTMGLWLDQLVDSDIFNRNEAKEICLNFVKNIFPKQFKGF